MLLINFYKKALAHLFAYLRLRWLTFFLCINVKLLFVLFPVSGAAHSELFFKPAEGFIVHINSESRIEEMTSSELKFESKTKEFEILRQQVKLTEQKLVTQQKNYRLLGFLVITLVFGVIGFLFYNQFKLKTLQLQKENELHDALIKIETQNKLQRQRIQISKDLHDNIGAQLAYIISSIDNLKYGFDLKDDQLKHKLSSISEFASETIYELRDSLWAMNKKGISIEDLQIRTSNFIDKTIIVEHQIEFKFDVSKHIEKETMFNVIEGMHIYRILQEAINNAIKHASATRVLVGVEPYLNNFKFKISDNGRGFDMSLIQKGNGFYMMRKRSRSIGGEIQINATIGKGTEVTLII